MTQQDAENEIAIRGIVRRLLKKSQEQLPPSDPDILALDTGKDVVSQHQIKMVPEGLLPQRQQVILIVLRSLERRTQIGEPPFGFLNQDSQFLDVGQELLKNLCKSTLI
jgi:hypothetical protein